MLDLLGAIFCRIFGHRWGPWVGAHTSIERIFGGGHIPAPNLEVRFCQRHYCWANEERQL
jgi:hypothetical protein